MDSKNRRDSSDSDGHRERKKHKKSKKPSKKKHKSKDKDKYGEDKDKKSATKTTHEDSDNEQEMSAIEKFNMFKKQREALKKNEGQVVDDLFKEFIASKIKQIENESADREKKKSKPSTNDKLNDEMSRFLDAEINNIEVPIQSTEHVHPSSTEQEEILESKENLIKERSVKSVYGKSVNENSETLRASAKENNVSDVDRPKGPSQISDTAQKVESSQGSLLNTVKSQTQESGISLENSKSPSNIDDTKPSEAGSNVPVFGPMLPKTVSEQDAKQDTKAEVKKPKIGFKNFGIKLTATSAELIQSGEIHKKGKRLEDGEVVSSSSEAEAHSQDSDDDSEVSRTGSIMDSLQRPTLESRGESKQSGGRLKKKHRSKDKQDTSKEKEVEISQSKRKHSARSKSRSPKRSKRSRSHSRDRSRRRSRSKDKSRSKRSRSHGRRSGSRRSKSRSRRSRSRGRKSRSKGHRSRSRNPRSTRSRGHRSRSKDKSRDRRSRSKSKRSKSKSPDRFWRSKYGDFDAFKFLKEKGRHRSRSRSPDRERDRFVEKENTKMEDLRLKIDKAKLREIAIQNALNNAKVGGVKLDATIKAGGKSVEELTEYCKKIQQKEQERKKYRYDQGYESSSSGEPARSGDEDDFHHPFKVKEAGPIVFDIPNAKSLPVVTPQERLVQSAQLRLTFPVSSGTQHRDKEWVPVEPEPNVKPAASGAAAPSSGGLPAIMPPPPPPADVKVFEDTPVVPVDIGAIVSERLNAVRKLQENPNDVSAKMILNQAQKQASQWAQSKNLPGQFIGSTGANILSQEELMGNKKKQAWLKKDVFTNAAPVNGGIGMYLLQKMGWKLGEGLGKNNEGQKEPLMLDFKIDRKGLNTTGEGKKTTVKAPVVKDLSGKHPVSALGELCNKRKWGAPRYDLVHESGPSHKKDFLFKVHVNGTDYQPSVTSNNKKLAKSEAATVCLQNLGLVPRTELVPNQS